MHTACVYGHFDMIKYLMVKKGLSLDSPLNNVSTCIFLFPSVLAHDVDISYILLLIIPCTIHVHVYSSMWYTCICTVHVASLLHVHNLIYATTNQLTSRVNNEIMFMSNSACHSS